MSSLELGTGQRRDCVQTSLLEQHIDHMRDAEEEPGAEHTSLHEDVLSNAIMEDASMLVTSEKILEMRQRAFFGALDADLLKVNAYHNKELSLLHRDFDNLEARVKYMLKHTEKRSGEESSSIRPINATEMRSMANSAKELRRRVKELAKFSSVNQVLFMKILRKYDETTGDKECDTYMDKVATMPFYSTHSRSILLSRINMIASYFREHDEKIAALEELGATKRERRLQLFVIGMLGGSSTYMYIIIIVFGFVVTTFKRVFPPMLVAVPSLVFCVTGAAVVMFACCRARIDYASILGMHGAGVATYATLFRSSTALMLVCFALTVHYVLAVFHVVHQRLFGVEVLSMVFDPIAVAVVLVGVALCPLDLFSRHSRASLLKSFGLVVASPLTTPSFGLAMLADVMSSLLEVLHFMLHSMCTCSKLLTEQSQRDICFGGDTQISTNGTHGGHDGICLCNSGLHYQPYGCISSDYFLMPLIHAAPIWFRLMQCLRVLYLEPSRLHILNVVRYSFCLFTIFLASMGGSNRAIVGCIGKHNCSEDDRAGWHTAWILVGLLTMGIVMVADVAVDWGAVHMPASRVPALRANLMLTPRAYYMAMLRNFLLLPCFMLLLGPYQDLVPPKVVVMFIFGEILRRTQWCFFSLEYQMVKGQSGKLLEEVLLDTKQASHVGQACSDGPLSE